MSGARIQGDTEGAASRRKEDANGYWEIADNPISKAGVYPYLGALLPGAKDPMKAYMVLRPPEELGAPETVESFKLQPWIMRHAMLGPEEKGLTPPEDKGVHGVIGERVYFRPETGMLYGNIKGFSEDLKAAIEGGEKELSAGYFHDVDWTAGVWEGEPYDAVQRNIRANHLALVPQGRMGPGVAVMDCLQGFDPNIFTIGKEINKMGELTLEKLAEAVTALLERMDRLEAAGKPSGHDNDGAGKDEAGAAEEEKEKNEAAAGDEAGAASEETKDAGATDNAGAAAKDEAGAAGKDSEGCGASKDEAGAGGAEEEKEKAAGASMDSMERSLMRRMAGRDALARKLASHVGTFDHAHMTAAEVAAYGCKKLGLACAKGQESAALAGYLAGAAKAPQQAFSMAFSMDAMPGGSGGMSGSVYGGKPKGSKALDNYLKGEK